MSPVPLPPTPMQPIVIRLLGAIVAVSPSADEGTMYGKATVAVAAFRKLRLEILFFFSILVALY